MDRSQICIKAHSGILIFFFILAATTLAQDPYSVKGLTFDGPAGKIYYELIPGGSGTPLILVNGGPGFDHTYLHLSEAWASLAGHRSIVFYDQRGNGGSSPLGPRGINTLEDQVADLEALRAHLGLDKIELLGHSWGGYLSMAYTVRHPARVSHLLLVGSAPPKWTDLRVLFDDVFPEISEHQRVLRKGSLRNKPAAAVYIRNYLSMLFYSPEKRDAFLARISPDSYNFEVNQALNRDLAGHDLSPEIRKFRLPTLIMTGRYDMNVAPVIAFRIHQAIPGSQFVVFERSGHMPFYEEPEAFVETVDAFLSN